MLENKICYDKNFVEIREEDLLKVWHFKSGRRTYYMYHTVVKSDTGFLAGKDYNRDGNDGHYWITSMCRNETDQYLDAEIISYLDYDRESAARKRRKQFKNQQIIK